MAFQLWFLATKSASCGDASLQLTRVAQQNQPNEAIHPSIERMCRANVDL